MTLNARRSRTQTQAADASYATLAKSLWPLRKKFTNFLGIKSCNRKFFEAACKELNGGRKP
jgi:hypothetical protein